MAHARLGIALNLQGKPDEATIELRETIRLKPNEYAAHVNLGIVLYGQRRLNDAAAEYREAIRLKPDDYTAHFDLGIALAIEGRLAEAVAEFREAVRLNPDDADSHVNLGHALRIQWEFVSAAEEYRKARDLTKGKPERKLANSDLELAEDRRLAIVAPRLSELLRGEDRPKDAAEAIEFAFLAYEKRKFGPAARWYAEAFSADSKLAEDLDAGNRYTAACSAAQVGAGKWEVQPPPSENEKTRWRKQALAWLKADLTRRTEHTRAGTTEAKVEVRRRLTEWKRENDFLGIRDETAITALPEDEQKACRAIWAEVDQLLKTVQ